jgi:NADPH-dependent 2,4-dienoyl-CoA reductase/sulfur reductase-like enzyme/rhodanese-related sulfurtransferase
MRLIIVGGVAGGASAAARARRLSEGAEIILIERGHDVSFANCGLPYHIGGEIARRDSLLVTTPDRLRERFRIDVRTRTSAIRIDRAARTVTLRDEQTGRESVEPWDRLILSTGAAPIRPDLPGVHLPAIHTLRNLADTDRLVAAARGATRAVVIGGGFIGLEMAEQLVHRGLAVTLIETNPQVLGPLDREMTTPIEESLRRHGVDLRLSEAATGFEPAPADAGASASANGSAEASERSGVLVRLRSGATVPADFVVLGIGVRPENQLAIEAGLELGPTGGIKVDRFMRTSDPDILAVGDAIEVEDFVLKTPARIPLAGPANRQGRIAAETALGKVAGSAESANGRPGGFRGSQGTAIVRVFDRTAAATGASEKTLRRAGRPFRKVYVHPAHHAGYYPGAEGMSLKLLFEPTSGRVLGAQGVGGAGVDKRIDILAIAIQAGLTVFDLEEVELCYAPPFGSAKDPVNMVGFVAANLLRGEHPQADMEEVMARPEEDRPFLLDVRTEAEHARGTIPGAINIPVDSLRERLGELPRDRSIAAFCQVGQRGYLATRILIQRGFAAVNLGGGYRTWQLHHPEG